MTFAGESHTGTAGESRGNYMTENENSVTGTEQTAQAAAVLTQDQVNQIIASRVKQAKESTEKKYADYESVKKANTDLEKRIAELEKAAAESDKKITAAGKERDALRQQISAYETSSVKMRIAREEGIPYELAERINGATEDEMREDAKTLAQFISRPVSAPPLKVTEPNENTDNKALRDLLKTLNTRKE